MPSDRIERNHNCNIDLVACIDVTSGMAGQLDALGTYLLSLRERVERRMTECSCTIGLWQLRVRVIAFRDYGVDEAPMLASRFFVLNGANGPQPASAKRCAPFWIRSERRAGETSRKTRLRRLRSPCSRTGRARARKGAGGMSSSCVRTRRLCPFVRARMRRVIPRACPPILTNFANGGRGNTHGWSGAQNGSSSMLPTPGRGQRPTNGRTCTVLQRRRAILQTLKTISLHN